jgi:hypothetical protein
VFLGVSSSLLLLFALTLAVGFSRFLPVPLHALWGLLLGLLIVLLQCLVFGFFIGSGKTIKKKVKEAGLAGDWVDKTKDYKNRVYPGLMLSISVMVAALAAGGAAAAGILPPWVHGSLMVLAWGLNARSFWIAFQTVSENVSAIHQINRLIKSQVSVSTLDSTQGGGVPDPEPSHSSALSLGAPRPAPSRYYFLALAVWVPYLYMRWSLGDRVFPLWPFVLLSLGLGTLGFYLSLGLKKNG